MPCFKCFQKSKKKDFESEISAKHCEDQEEEINILRDYTEEARTHYGTKIVYFACATPQQHLINTLHYLDKDVQTFTVETECIEHITSITKKKVFLIMDGSPSSTLTKAMKGLYQLDSVFVYSQSADSIAVITRKPRAYLIHWCENENALIDAIRKSRDEVDQHTSVLSMFNAKQINQKQNDSIIYFTSDVPKQNLINTLQSRNEDLQTFTMETECIKYMTAIQNDIFFIIDGSPSITLIEAMDKFKQIDSVFIYSPLADSITAITQEQHAYLINWCENEAVLMDTIEKSREELEKQRISFIMHSTHSSSREAGTFLYFQLFKNVLTNMPKTAEAKKTMVTTCRNYYRGNLTELANIDEFDRTYRSADAIRWYTKETFLYKLINKAIRIRDVEILYQFHFYFKDLSEQLEIKFQQLKKQKYMLKLYRGIKLTHDEVINFQNSIGDFISTNGYLSMSSQYSVAYGFVTKITKREGIARVLFEYQVDLSVVQNIVIADIQEYSAYPEKAEFFVDIGATFQIDSCQYNAEDDLWHIQVHATDQGHELTAEFMEYQKKKMTESNIVLMFGNLLLEMGEYAKAERYFDTILISSNPNDEEIACIFYNFGRTHRLKGDFNRAINCYNRAYNLHINTRPKRLASAGKSLNGLGVVFLEQGKLFKAKECFQQAMKLYRKSIPKDHIDVADALTNLGTTDCEQQDHSGAIAKHLQVKKIYDRTLPAGHPNHALLKVNLGNVYLIMGQYDKALEECESALKIQEMLLPEHHPDIVRTLHNLAQVHAYRGDLLRANEYIARAEEMGSRILSARHPLMTLIKTTKDFIDEENGKYVDIQQ